MQEYSQATITLIIVIIINIFEKGEVHSSKVKWKSKKEEEKIMSFSTLHEHTA